RELVAVAGAAFGKVGGAGQFQADTLQAHRRLLHRHSNLAEPWNVALIQVKIAATGHAMLVHQGRRPVSAAKPKDTYGHPGTEDGTLRGELERLAGMIEQAAKGEGGEALKGAADAARRLADQAGKGQAELEQLIRQKPLTAVAIAGAAGFLL